MFETKSRIFLSRSWSRSDGRRSGLFHSRGEGDRDLYTGDRDLKTQQPQLTLGSSPSNVGMLTGLDFPGSRKNFPFPGKKMPERENFGKLCTIHHYKIPWQQFAAQRTLPDAGRLLDGVISFTITAGVC